MTPVPRAELVSDLCGECGLIVRWWQYPGDAPRPLFCEACTAAGRRGAAGYCLMCPRGIAHGWVEFCATCWTGLWRFPRELYHAHGRAALLAFLRGHDFMSACRSRYHR